jgi:hypothetical protein
MTASIKRVRHRVYRMYYLTLDSNVHEVLPFAKHTCCTATDSIVLYIPESRAALVKLHATHSSRWLLCVARRTSQSRTPALVQQSIG